MVSTKVEQMKWWGWGGENIEFDMASKPDLWPYIKNVLGIEQEIYTPPVKFEDIEMPEQRLNNKFLTTIKPLLNEEQVKTDKIERLIHAYGKSFRDLWRIRRGIIEAAADCVIYPQSEDDVCSIIKAASECDVIIIPFGGGSNIAGCLEARGRNGRMVVSLDMKRMNQVIEVDHESCTARIQAGVMGPDMENQLSSFGVTLGHFPDSFEYSSLGGWVATRSAGMQSDKYGKIEDMVISLRMVTPSGTIVTRTVPKSSNGIDVNHICIGSEGILGVITEATMQVHHIPECREFYGYLFPDFESGAEAIHECVEKECQPVITRFNDSEKTALSFAYKSKSSGFKSFMAKGVKAYLNKKFDLDKACLMLTAFEGDKKTFNYIKKRVNAIYKKQGAFNLGTDPGKSFEKGKYDFPYLRDYVMDRNIIADVSETSTVWSNVLPLYYATYDALDKAIRNTGSKTFLGCHISHSYQTGTSLYFTFGALQEPGKGLQQYLYIKKAAEDAFMKNGATLSHHHAVGYEHMPWLEDDISTTGVKAVKALKLGLDPKGVMNPGKIIPTETPFQNWGLKEQDVAEFDRNGSSANGENGRTERLDAETQKAESNQH